MTELSTRDFSIDPTEMTYHRDRYLEPEHQCETVRFVGAFHGDNVLTNEIQVECRGIYKGESAWYVLRYKDQISDVFFNLRTCQYNTETNLVLVNPITLVFKAEYKEGVAA